MTTNTSQSAPAARFLFVSNLWPWPEVSGSRLRAAASVRALAALGEVDVFCLLFPNSPVPSAPPRDQGVARWTTAVVGRRSHAFRRAGWMLAHAPRDVAGYDFAAARAAFTAWTRPEYDLVWMAGADAWTAVADLVNGPVVCNLNDVEHRKIDALLEVEQSGPSADTAVTSRLRTVLSRQSKRLNRRRWRTYYQRIGESVRTVVVCSDLDRSHLGATNAAVVPNIYPEPRTPLGRVPVGTPPTVSIIGQLHYPPNADGAAFFVHEVLPKLRELVPEVQVRLVGDVGPTVESLGDIEGVTVTGLVDDIATELSRADVCAVPIRFGGGTRIKILEAFAHRIPVVSTTLGAEGLEVRDDEHLVLADDPTEFARGCASLLKDEARRARLEVAAHEHWRQCFTEDAFRAAVAGVAGGATRRQQAS